MLGKFELGYFTEVCPSTPAPTPTSVTPQEGTALEVPQSPRDNSGLGKPPPLSATPKLLNCIDCWLKAVFDNVQGA